MPCVDQIGIARLRGRAQHENLTGIGLLVVEPFIGEKRIRKAGVMPEGQREAGGAAHFASEIDIVALHRIKLDLIAEIAPCLVQSGAAQAHFGIQLGKRLRAVLLAQLGQQDLLLKIGLRAFQLIFGIHKDAVTALKRGLLQIGPAQIFRQWNLVKRAIAVNADRGEIHVARIDPARRMVEICQDSGIEQFYNISSIHALDARHDTPYAQSKRAGTASLEEVSGLNVINLYLPFVRGTRWNGKLSFLNSLPPVLAGPLASCLLALKPSVSIEKLAAYVLSAPEDSAKTIILSDGQSGNATFNALKRVVDLVFAFTVILFLWWALLIVWALIRAGSPGPGLFAQERVGQHGKTFLCYKFRTMQQGTVQAGTHEVSAASITRIGHFLRRSKIDELPQVWNILRNEISLIGPRPGLPVQTALFEARQARGVFAVKPGISGLAQINDIDMSDPERLADWDARYIALQSLLLDAKIIMATLIGKGRGDRAATSKA